MGYSNFSSVATPTAAPAARAARRDVWSAVIGADGLRFISLASWSRLAVECTRKRTRPHEPLDSTNPPLAVHCLYPDRRRQLRRDRYGSEGDYLGNLLSSASVIPADVYRSLSVRAAISGE